jgi:hypothetical protein
MTRTLAAAALAFALPAASAAQTPVSPDAFEAMSEGRTLHFTLQGEPFGAEQYFPGRRSLWRFVDGTCESGSWRAEGDRICFTYDGDPETQCWRFMREDSHFRAALVGKAEVGDFVLELSHSDDARLPCPGHDLGT